MSSHRWLFSKERLLNSPSRSHGIDEEKELLYLQRVSNCIQDMGRDLALPLLCMNTAILFTQRFYVYHPLTVFEKFGLGASALFLAAKVEEHPRKVEDVCKIARRLGLIPEGVSDQDYISDLLFNESVLLQTLGFDVKVQHPHQHVLLLCEFIKASKHLARTSYILATYCLHLTKMCLTNKPAIIACVSIYTAAKMLNIEIPVAREGKVWFLHADNSLTISQLDSLTVELITALRKCPDQFKSRTLKHLVKKLDSSYLGVFGTSIATVSCPAILDGSIPEGLHSTLKEEYSLITSSLQYESKKCQEIPIKAAALNVSAANDVRAPSPEKMLDSKPVLKTNLCPIAAGENYLKCQDPSMLLPNSALTASVKTEKVKNSTISVLSAYASDAPSQTESNQGNSYFRNKPSPHHIAHSQRFPSSAASNIPILRPNIKECSQSPKKLTLTSSASSSHTVALTAGGDARKTISSGSIAMIEQNITRPGNSTCLKSPPHQQQAKCPDNSSRLLPIAKKEPSLKVSIPRNRISCITEGNSSSPQLSNYRVKKHPSPTTKKFKLN